MASLLSFSPDCVAAFRKFSTSYAAKTEQVIRRFYAAKTQSANHPLLKALYAEISGYVLRDGKRIRPVLLMAGCRGYGGAEQPIEREALKLAAALEVMHSFLLIQDDIIDRSPMRRGLPSLHLITAEKFTSHTASPSAGTDTASIMADIVFSNALEMIAGTKVPAKQKDAFMQLFARTYEMTAFGQILDITRSNPKKMTPGDDSAAAISLHKTAFYTVYYPLAMGAALAGENRTAERKAIERFALPLGLAFQVRDDLLGVFGDPAVTGKPADSDIREGKLTILVQNACDLLQGEERERFTALFTREKRSAADAAAIKKLIEKSGAYEKTVQAWEDYVGEAAARLADLSIRPKERAILQGFAAAVADPKGLAR